MHLPVVVALLLAIASPAAWAQDTTACVRSAGGLATHCLRRWLTTVERCRVRQDASCEAAARTAAGPLAQLIDGAALASAACDEAAASTLGYQSVDDVGVRTQDGCGDWGEAFLALTWSTNGPFGGRSFICQRAVAKAVKHIRQAVVAAYGPGCYLRQTAGHACRRSARDRAAVQAAATARQRITQACGDNYDTLGLAPLDTLLTNATTLARHFAQLTYPPNDLGPTAELGAYPVGIRTVALLDTARSNVQGTGPRPVTIEIYYPTTPAAVAGLPRDIAKVLGIEVATTPAWRDVPLRPGTYPLIVFSHGNNGIRIQSFFFGAHLASHGYIVVSADHHGNTFPDTLAGVIDPLVGANRPLDLSFVISQMLAASDDPGSLWHGAVDSARIGASGHSFGGYTAFALAGGTIGNLGTFADARVKAIFPQAPLARFDDAFYQAIHVPTLIVGGSIDETTPFPTDQQAPFDRIPSGPAILGLAELTNGGHFTFSDFCEVDRVLLGFLGGFGEACEPRHLPFRHAHDITNYLALNFFDAALRGDIEALARLEPSVVGQIEDLRYQRK